MIKRGDVVILDFPFVGGGAGKTRPAVVVQCDRLNQKIENTIVAMITGNIGLIGKEPTQFLIDPATPEGKSSGLKLPSAVRCQNLATVAQGRRSRGQRASFGRVDAKARGLLEGDAGVAVGIIFASLNGTAKGGAIFGVKQKLNLPVKFVGLGEGIDDLEVFDSEEYVEKLFED